MEVQFQNFRCFRDTGQVPIRPVTILVGENSSGKTSFLAGLNHLFALIDGSADGLNSAPFELGSFKDIAFRSAGGPGFRSFTYKFFSTSGGTATWKFENNGGDPFLTESSVESLEGESLLVGRTGIHMSLRLEANIRDALKALGFSVKKRPLKEAYSISRDDINTKTTRRIITQSERQNVFVQGRYLSLLLEDWIEALVRLAEDTEGKREIEYKPRSIFIEFDRRLRRMIRDQGFTTPKFKAFAPIRETPQRVYLHESSDFFGHDARGVRTATRLMKLSQKDPSVWASLKEDLEFFGRSTGLFESIIPHPLVRKSQYPFEIRLKSKHGRISNLCDVGYGVSQSLPLLVEFLHPASNSGFLIQQPEVHLHPKAQAEFGTLVASLANKDRNFVIETHSDFILERIGLEIKNGRLDKDKVVILFFEPTEPEVMIHPIYLGVDGSPTDAPPSYRKFFLEEFRRLWG